MMLKSILRRSIARIKRVRLHNAQTDAAFTVYGTPYGGWPVIDGTLSDNSVVYSFGIGEDISFDVGIIGKFDCNVWGFDPTPKCANWIERQNLPSRFHFHQIGLDSKEGMVEFFPPANPEHVSYSASPGAGQDKSGISAPVKPVEMIMKELGHTSIDVLKMDIEGFEYRVLEAILTTTVRPKQLLVEFHHGMYGNERHQTIRAVESLCAAGYRLFYVADGGREYGFVMA